MHPRRPCFYPKPKGPPIGSFETTTQPLGSYTWQGKCTHTQEGSYQGLIRVAIKGTTRVTIEATIRATIKVTIMVPRQVTL